ncbi:hypothetical protein [Glycomyces harbinensis]|uniref:Prenyltransferase and squalene oxidase repeat-containing protein n=1 Tax=Glycomyces harbinensis TaxID=58114 RepID=A0A1G6VZQ9_9ACTN|nr:hypothetical protein [Glycomyces harbinensis]SDD59014.1 hypothetical protein SAMN05216270_105221 [Glycomyces harbinensis]
MTRITDTMTERSAEFVWLTGSVLDQHRYALWSGGGSREAALAALDAHRTTDGGFAFALEADVKGPDPQPLTAMTALEILDEIGALDQTAGAGVCDWLARYTAADGGVPDLLTTITAYPRPPWVEAPPQDEGGLLTTARAVGMLLKHRIDHPWVEGATAFCRSRIDAIETSHPYEVFSVLAFLEHCPDRAWAEAAAKRVGAIVREAPLVLLDPANPDGIATPPGYAEHEFTFACDFAGTPDGVAAAWFTRDEMRAALDHLVSEQREDGGWPIHYKLWNPAIEQQARPRATIAALKILKAWEGVV